MKKNNILFPLDEGIYPYRVGGMEVFNYYFIKNISKYFNVSYIGNHSYDFDGPKFISGWKGKPQRLLIPLQLFFYLLFHRNERNIFISFAATDRFRCFYQWLFIKLFNLNSICIIHYGKAVPTDKWGIFKRLLHCQKKVISVSHDIKRNYDRAFNLDSMVLYPLVPFELASNSIDYYRKLYNIPIKSTVISMIGRLYCMKNNETILDALHLMTQSELAKLKPCVVYVGTGDMLESLKEKASALGVEQYVRFLGMVPKEKINEIMKLSDFYLIASDFEGTSVSLLEAMFNEKVILSSRAPGLVDMLCENIDCYMFAIKDASQLKDKIFEAYNNKNESIKRASSAKRNYNKSYNYDTLIETYVQLFNSIMR